MIDLSLVLGPMPFTAENLQKSIDGTKTQTRRIEGLKQINDKPDEWKLDNVKDVDGGFYFWTGEPVAVDAAYIKPRHQVGDILYLPEPTESEYAYDNGIIVKYDTGRDILFEWRDVPEDVRRKIDHSNAPIYRRRRTSRFMFKFMARYFMEITGVGPPHRVQGISLADIQAEGIPDNRATHNAPIQLARWGAEWVSINGQESWDRNDWVMPYTYKMIEGD